MMGFEILFALFWLEILYKFLLIINLIENVIPRFHVQMFKRTALSS